MQRFFYATIAPDMQIIDGKKIRDEILAGLKTRVAALPTPPVFCDVLVGNDPASAQYVAMKERVAESIGIQTHTAAFPADITTEALVAEIKKIADMPHMAGLIVQLPLPAHIDQKTVLDAVPTAIDVDALGSETSLAFYTGTPQFVYPTAAAVLAVLDSAQVDLSDKNIVIAGKGMLVGKPVAHLLTRRGVSVVSVDSDTPNTEKIFPKADVLISATGKAGLITGDMIQKHAVLIDAGTSESNGGIVGDIDRVSVEGRASMLAPVPGGVGPVTVAMLMQNIVIAAERMAKV